ncbi:hypothetical protein AVEN_33752-1 [Araneus ventricosus]|uniref:Integrase zinc-binding domain-containing protein n=1 Tax=Araneus ventricosus TaxID=182803 RepID=A0A4Y2W2W1_ARAVE|nr:hypothetical protein AVEN_33752-1 [Araneus ventricosus]
MKYSFHSFRICCLRARLRNERGAGIGLSIPKLIANCCWTHVPSPLDPADLVSRGLRPRDLPELKLWWSGPSFLERGELSSGPGPPLMNESEYSCELKNGVVPELPISSIRVSTNCDLSFLSDLLCMSNSYVKILRIFNYVLRFVNVIKSNVIVSGPLSASELDQAENRLIGMVQGEVFSAEIRNLQCKKGVLPNSKLRNLNPFLDSDGVLRVGGRLGNSDLPYVTKYPAILPNRHKLTNQIIAYFHLKNLHIGASSLLHCARERFWPLNGRSLCRKIVYECIICFKARPIVTSQLIAVHIEIVSDLTSEVFIATLKRVLGRRGKCAKLHFDNSKTFVGANQEIKGLLKLVKEPDEQLSGFLSTEGIE